MSKALSPQEAIVRFKNEVPEPVLEAWNSVIVSNLRVQGGKVSSQFTLDELANKVTSAMNVNRSEAVDKGWLSLEDIFRDRGWKIDRDTPGYNESYPTRFTFKGQ